MGFSERRTVPWWQMRHNRRWKGEGRLRQQVKNTREKRERTCRNDALKDEFGRKKELGSDGYMFDEIKGVGKVREKECEWEQNIQDKALSQVCVVSTPIWKAMDPLLRIQASVSYLSIHSHSHSLCSSSVVSHFNTVVAKLFVQGSPFINTNILLYPSA